MKKAKFMRFGAWCGVAVICLVVAIYVGDFVAGLLGVSGPSEYQLVWPFQWLGVVPAIGIVGLWLGCFGHAVNHLDKGHGWWFVGLLVLNWLGALLYYYVEYRHSLTAQAAVGPNRALNATGHKAGPRVS